MTEAIKILEDSVWHKRIMLPALKRKLQSGSHCESLPGVIEKYEQSVENVDNAIKILKSE